MSGRRRPWPPARAAATSARRRSTWAPARAAAFALGVAALLVALSPPLDAQADERLSAHMVQHLLLTLVAAPLLVAGAPVALVLRALPRHAARHLTRVLRSPAGRLGTHPLLAWSLLPALMLATHLTGLYEYALGHPQAHAAEHAAYLAAALLFWLPALGGEPLWRRLGAVGRLLYLLLAMPAMAAPGIVLSLDQHVRYSSYGSGAAALADQRAAGTIMWVAGSVLAAGLTVLAAWLALEQEERRALAREARQPLLLLAIAGATLALAAPPASSGQSGSYVDHKRPVIGGRALFAGSCASCHGLAGRGVPGRGPSLEHAGAQAADFYLRTGRMPLANPDDAPVRTPPPFTDAEIRALTAYVASLGNGPPVPRVDPAQGDLAAGRHAFAEHCAGCHQIVGRGGIVTGAIAPPLQESTPTDVAEAVRIGPYLMPRFTRRQIDDRTLADIARYVAWTKHPDDRGGWSIGNIGPIPEGMVAWFVGLLALLVVIRLIGERSPR
jgi:cytochrome c oxidase assembly factor CtaG/cytochrome c2